VSHLGPGHFGNVDRGLWRSAKSNAGVPVEVALKSLTEDVNFFKRQPTWHSSNTPMLSPFSVVMHERRLKSWL